MKKGTIEFSVKVPEYFPRVKGNCPKGCGATLFLGSGGYVTCSYINCPEPDAASKLLSKGLSNSTFR